MTALKLTIQAASTRQKALTRNLDPTWEEDVPPGIVATIKAKHLVGRQKFTLPGSSSSQALSHAVDLPERNAFQAGTSSR